MTGSIPAIVTFGFGSFGAPGLVVTFGFGPGAPPAPGGRRFTAGARSASATSATGRGAAATTATGRASANTSVGGDDGDDNR